MTTTSSSRSVLDIEFDDGTTDIDVIPMDCSTDRVIKIFSIGGQCVAKVRNEEFERYWQTLPAGVYIVNGKKTIK